MIKRNKMQELLTINESKIWASSMLLSSAVALLQASLVAKKVLVNHRTQVSDNSLRDFISLDTQRKDSTGLSGVCQYDMISKFWRLH